MKQARVAKSQVNGDIPGKLAKEFSPELALPTSIIFNQILKTGNWPKNWKIETGIPLAKTSEPMSESDIRIVSLTNWSSKILEKFVVEWLWEVIGEKIDPKQFGGKKKVSTVHYLIEFVTFILYNWDLQQSQAVVATLLDFSKAFNRVNHKFIITRLAEWGAPIFLIKIVMGFLTGRKLQVKFQGKMSDLMDMPGGGPAGTILSMVVLIILINPIEFTQKLHLGAQITQKLSKRDPMMKMHLKYFDDVSLLESINLKDSLKKEDKALERPLNFHQRTGHVICEEKFQTLQKIREVQSLPKIVKCPLTQQKPKL